MEVVVPIHSWNDLFGNVMGLNTIFYLFGHWPNALIYLCTDTYINWILEYICPFFLFCLKEWLTFPMLPSNRKPSITQIQWHHLFLLTVLLTQLFGRIKRKSFSSWQCLEGSDVWPWHRAVAARCFLLNPTRKSWSMRNPFLDNVKSNRKIHSNYCPT